MDPSIWQNAPSVSVNENEMLCKPFSEIEIKNALDQMEKKIKLLDQTKSRLNSTKVVGILSRVILYNFLMIFIIIEWILVE
jgi:hypothetical protein